MLETILELIRDKQMLPPGSKVLCAVSGGADSVCLLHHLYRLRRTLDIEVVAAHYNHMLRGEESERDQHFVEQFVELCCGPDRFFGPFGVGQTLPAVELQVGRGDVAEQARRTGQGVEETARTMRYAFLEETAARLGCTHIATAHNADDNAETLLMNLIRGSGLRGLGGIPPIRGNIIRPLLTTPRKEIEAYLRGRGLTWVEDSTNREDAYTRNRVRHRVTPELEEISPGFSRRLLDATALLREDEQYLERAAEQALGQVHTENGQVRASAVAVAKMEPPVAVRAVRILLGRARGGDERCTSAHLRALRLLCRSTDPSAQIDLPDGWIARREYDELVLCRKEPAPLLEPKPVALPGETEAGEWSILCRKVCYEGQRQNPFEWYLDAKSVFELTVRTRRQGDRLTLPGRPEKTVKKWLIDEKIPAIQRDTLPVLEMQGHVAAVAGLGPDRAVLAKTGESAWQIQIIKQQR